MSKRRRNTAFLPLEDTLFAVKQRKVVPHEFVLDAIAPLSPATRPMFGCLAVYVEDKILFKERVGSIGIISISFPADFPWSPSKAATGSSLVRFKLMT